MLAACLNAGPRVRLRVNELRDQSKVEVISLGMDDYVRGVVEAEIEDGRSDTAFVRALARVVWSYASHPRHKGQGYDFCDYTHCQLYKGPSADDAKFKQALKSLRPLKGPARHFSRCCGGRTDEAASVWGQARGRVVDCVLQGQPLCAKDPLFRWQARIPFQQLLRAAGSALGAPVQDIQPMDFTPGGRLRRFRVIRPSGEFVLQAHEFYSAYGRLYGWRDLHSLHFEMTRQGAEVLVQGRGFGHGVGLCQSGALALARKGWDEQKILDFYFPGTKN